MALPPAAPQNSHDQQTENDQGRRPDEALGPESRRMGRRCPRPTNQTAPTMRAATVNPARAAPHAGRPVSWCPNDGVGAIARQNGEDERDHHQAQMPTKLGTAICSSVMPRPGRSSQGGHDDADGHEGNDFGFVPAHDRTGQRQDESDDAYVGRGADPAQRPVLLVARCTPERSGS